jgi:UDP-3-O-acyl-N-acetylglucosamine deacetylase
MEYLKSTDIGAGSILDNSLNAEEGWNSALRNTDEFVS